MKHHHSSLFIALLAFFIYCAPMRAMAEQGPAQTVALLQKAVDDCDMAAVERYLDLGSVTDKAAAVAVADKNVLSAASENPTAAVVIALGSAAGVTDAVRDMLAAEAKEYVRHGVVSGAFAGTPKDGAPAYRGIFAKAFRGGAKDKKTFGPASIVSQQGATARVRTSLRSGTKAKTQPLDLIMERQSDVWRIVEIANLPAILSHSINRNKK